MTVLLAWLSAVPLRQLLVRSAVVPLVSAGIAVPQTVLLLGDVLAWVLGFVATDAGVAYVVLFTFHIGVGVALLSLIVMTTPSSSVVAAMRELRVPIVPIWVVVVTYRYLFLFFDKLQRFILAWNSRMTGQLSLRDGWRDAKRLVGTFLLRALDRGKRVGRGMRACGGSRPPSLYSRSRGVDGGNYALVAFVVVAVTGLGVTRWGL